MINSMILAAEQQTADVYTLINDLFTESLTVLFIGGLIVCAVILGGKLRGKHDLKAAQEDDENN